MIKTENLTICQAVNKASVSVLTDDGLYILSQETLEKFIVKCIKSGKAEKFDK